MTTVTFPEKAEDGLLQFAVILARYEDKWVFCKHRDRHTYEVPGGHREPGEDILTTARRELQEETGALKFDLSLIGPYCVDKGEGITGMGMLFFSQIYELGEIHSEIEHIRLFDGLPDPLTYPDIQPRLMEELLRRRPNIAGQRLDPVLTDYVEKSILPLYSRNDAGHRQDHILYVIRRSLLFIRQFAGLDPDMVYAAAAYHDFAAYIDRKRHEILSAQAFMEDGFMARCFTGEQRRVICEAIEDHRASLEGEPRSEYGRILSSADRSTDADDFLRRTHAYSLKYYPENTLEENLDRILDHIRSKYGEGGYARMYLEDSEYDSFLAQIRSFCQDRATFEQHYRRVCLHEGEDPGAR